MITGGCECGAVKYNVDGELLDFSHCHCSICRRLHGAAFTTWGGVSRDKLTYMSGEENLKRYGFTENSDSIFCDICGSRLLVDYKPDADTLYITLGTVEGDVKCPPGSHQFVGSKAPWFEITDDLPQYETEPDE